MKKFLFVLLASIGMYPAFAQSQTDKGSLMLGSNLAWAGAMFTTTSNNAQFNIQLSPQAGYFIAKNFALGTGIQLGMFKNGKTTGFNYGILPFARGYFKSKSRSQFFLEGDFGLTSQYVKNTDPINAFARTDYGFTVGFGPGYNYHITPNVSLEALYKIRLNQYDIGSSRPSAVYIVPSLNIGFQIFLRSKAAVTNK